jgi:hypothetical protein
MPAIPKNNWQEIIVEIDRLLRQECLNYPAQIYVTPRLIIDGVKRCPEDYPILSSRNQATVTRWISWHLRDTGRVLRTKTTHGRSCWMIPDQEQKV